MPPEQEAPAKESPGTEAKPGEASGEFQDDLNIVAHSFSMLYNQYAIEVGAFQAAVGVKDPVGWAPTLAEALLDFALGKATEKIAAEFAGRLMDLISSAPPASNAPSPLGGLRTRNAKAVATISLPAAPIAFDPKPFVTGMFAKGLGVGSAKGKEMLRSEVSLPPLARFVAANLQAANFATNEDRKQFISKGQHQVTTKQQALALRLAFSDDAVAQAGKRYQEQTRDAWVSYIAQQQFGEGAGGLTDLRAQPQRDFSNKPINRDGPAAPKPADGMHGKNNGVLEVWAELPATNGMWMNGEPKVKAAVLAGVNQVMRTQYEHRNLAECRVPRQIIATVKGGGHPDFVLNLDEEGLVSRLSGRESGWLRDRSTVNHPENLAKDDGAKKHAGLKLLLEDLVLPNIEGKAW